MPLGLIASVAMAVSEPDTSAPRSGIDDAAVAGGQTSGVLQEISPAQEIHIFQTISTHDTEGFPRTVEGLRGGGRGRFVSIVHLYGIKILNFPLNVNQSILKERQWTGRASLRCKLNVNEME